MLTGSMVSNYWGIPRTTHDLDFVIQLPDRFVQPLLTAFTGDFVLDPQFTRFAFRPPYQFNAIDTRSSLKVDFWILQPHPFDQNMFSRRLQQTLFHEPAWICTAEDVILHKLYWNKLTPSDRQTGDAAGVVAVQGEGLDTAYLRHWAKEIQVSETMEELLSGKIRPKKS